jgi:hypothetical protein
MKRKQGLYFCSELQQESQTAAQNIFFKLYTQSPGNHMCSVFVTPAHANLYCFQLYGSTQSLIQAGKREFKKSEVVTAPFSCVLGPYRIWGFK